MAQNIDSILAKGKLTRADMIYLLSLSRHEDVQKLYASAYDIKRQYVGTKVFFRGLIEFSNMCEKNCFYCGIRQGNSAQQRYMMSHDEILEAALWAHENGYGSIVLQSGERSDQHYIRFVETIIKRINEKTGGRLSMTLSLGEQERQTYLRWRDSGACRYLLRIETSSPELYAKIHPADHSFNRRVQCLNDLKDLGYQVGTGVMIGLPWQMLEHLADDILFFERMEIDMIGMGPYVAHDATPLAGQAAHIDKGQNFDVSLKMIAIARIVLRDVNIAATTALQALNPIGREMGLQAGANVIMPIITDKKYRPLYQLYNEKPCVEENPDQCKGCLERRIGLIHETIAYHEAGDPPHFFRRTRNPENAQT